MTITDWPENAAMHRLLEATLIFRDIHGTAALQGFLQAELARETVIAELAERNKKLGKLDPDAASSWRPAFELLSGNLDTALKALEFYADADNYISIRQKPAAIAKDRGKRARAAFEAISGEAETDDDGEAE